MTGELLTQARLVSIEHQRRVNSALSDPQRPKAPGLTELSKLETAASVAAEKLENERARLSDEQRFIDLKFRTLENLKARHKYATDQLEHFKGVLNEQTVKRDSLIGSDQLSPSLAIRLQGEVTALADVCKAFPPTIKAMESDIKKLESELKPFITPGGENEG